MKIPFRKILYSILLILLVLYPNLYLAGKQAVNQVEGMESLIDPRDPKVVEMGEYIRTHNLNAEEYVYSTIEWASDYDVYWNLEYWASPKETIEKEKGDCEDRAILLKSVEEYLQITSEIVVQKDHVYVLKDNVPYGGVSNTESYRTVIWNVIKRIPFIRKIIIIVGLFMIWGGYTQLKQVKRNYLSKDTETHKTL